MDKEDDGCDDFNIDTLSDEELKAMLWQTTNRRLERRIKSALLERLPGWKEFCEGA